MNTDAIKQAAHGRWPEILRSLAPELSEAIDARGRHVRCPLPGHDDQNPSFRFDDQGEGKAICSCGSYDGLGLLQQVGGWDFPTTTRQVVGYLGVTGNGRPGAQNILAHVAGLKHISVDSLKTYGATVDQRNGHPVVRIPVYNERGVAHSHFDLGVNTDKLKKGMFRAGKGSAGLFFPGCTPKLDDEWILCEGVKDACAYHGLGYLACGLNTDQMAVKYARLFTGVNVIIMPDRTVDAENKAQKTAGKLYGKAAGVRIGTLPLEIGGGKGDDARDVLKLADGETLLRQAVDDAAEWHPGEDEELGLRIAADGLTKVLADAICEDNHFARDAGGKLYRFRGGAYRAQAEQYVKGRIKAILEEWKYTREWTPRQSNAVVEYIGVDAPELWERPQLDVINVKNGLLRLSDRTLLDHSPEHLSCVQLPVKYDPEATCPAIDKFVSEVFPADAIELAYEIAGDLMQPDRSIQKAILATGEGSNGKSTYLDLLATFVGKQNTAAVSLHKLEANQFAAARLVGKLANICPDLPSSHLESTSTFKNIVGNDTLNTEYKHKDSFEFTPFCRLVFSANHPPRSQDASHAFFRRWLVIPFDLTIDESEAIPRAELDAKLSAPSELSGLLNKALDALKRIKDQHGFSEPESVRAAWREFHATTDPLAVWLDRFTVDHPDAIVPKATLRSAYGAECERRGRPSPTDKAFGSSLYRLRPDVDEAQRTVNGKVQWCYTGIGMSVPERDVSQDSRDSRDSSLFNCESNNHEEKQSEKAVEIQSRAKAVNPVNLVNDDLCSDGGPHTWLDTPESDGKTRRFCTVCCKFGGFVRTDGVVVQTLEGKERRD